MRNSVFGKPRGSSRLAGVAATIAVASLAVAGWPSPAQASSQTYHFTNISSGLTSNEQGIASEVGANISMTVNDAGQSSAGNNSLVEFIFKNNNTIQSSVTEIYFFDGALLGSTMGIDNGDNVNFVPDTNPGSLPGWVDFFGPPGPPATAAFQANPATPQPMQNAINVGEELAITFELLSGTTYDDVIASIQSGMSGGFDSGNDLIVGLHIQGIGDEGFSASFVVIPLPAPVAMGLLGLVGVGVLSRRRLIRSDT